ncbi:helicase-related protein [Candidatus Poriferisocius sp.]|uniref:helicase-related protein n=1 Tax=Candidatus Poriferisocius sp. TaxID=3101276 RepID=UPI003B59D872
MAALGFDDLTAGKRLSGVVADGDVTVVALDVHGTGSATLTYRSATGGLGERIITLDDLATIQEVSQQRWSFDADGAAFRLASEARRMKSAHLADPYAAVDTSNIEPYPHQIDAVYNRFLEQRPLKFLLADDPGAGKTIMSGLLIRELMLRGDVARCLIVAPGSLVEQWQDEMWDKFGLSFELMSRSAVEASRTGNPFLEKNLLVARVDQLSRAEDLIEKLKLADWDLVIVDEAHKMSAHLYGDELRKTKRFELGEVLRDQTRHFLLLSATPHNGKNEDFLAFMTLIDPERFAGRLRDDQMPETDDVMRRLVKENLCTFEGRRLFPERTAESVNFELSEPEAELYEAVTDYVRNGMDRANRMQEEGDRRRGIIFGFALAALQRRLASSPAAIYHSLRRRRDRLTNQAAELRRLSAGGKPVSVADLPRGVRFADLVDFDFDNFDDVELEELEDHVIDATTASSTAEELEAEVVELEELVKLAEAVRSSGEDTKWIQLRGLLRSDQFRAGNGEGSDEGSAPSGPRKLIVFSEHKDTLDYVADRIAAELGNPEAVAVIHGGIKRHDRRAIQDRFRVDPAVRVLVATDAAGEGVNLQVANMMVNYDLPWNPNRIEQRFGRIHRIGQQRPCRMWNLIAHETREGVVFTRLFEKIEQQRGVYGDQVYDVLGDSHINTSLQELLLKAITADDDPAHLEYMNEVIESDYGHHLVDVLKQRALVGDLADPAANDKIREDMERARARKLQPWFVHAFFSEALRRYGGRIVGREQGRFEITRIPAAIRSLADAALGPVHDRYERVTFDKACIQIDGGDRAELISPGTPLLTAVINKVLADHERTLSRGATLVDPEDRSTNPRLLVYLDHSVTDGREVHGHRQVVSRRFQYVEIDHQGNAKSAGNEPYIGYAPLGEEDRALLDGHLDLDWADHTAEETAKSWAIEHLSQPHFEEINRVTEARVDKVRAAVRERLEAEVRYWDLRAEELKAQELAGQKPRLNSGRARARAEDLAARLVRRRLDLDQESDLHNSPPTVVGAAIIVPQGLIDHLRGMPPDPKDTADKMETDRRAVAAVLEAERTLGRIPEAQSHSNPGYDVLSVDPDTGTHYFIEVKGHLPRTTEIHISAQQISKAKSLPDRWRLAIVSVPDDPTELPTAHYLIDPFTDYTPHFAQTGLALNVADLLAVSGSPS